VTLQCGPTQWRVAYSFLHRVVDVDGMVQEAPEPGAVLFRQKVILSQ
jgi:hypothetical protein